MNQALTYFIDSVLAYHAQAFEEAARLAQRAADADPEHIVYRQAVEFLRVVNLGLSDDVYISPEGFEKFIRGGGNLPLYANTSAALNRIYAENGPMTLLDIGVGDGHALLPALSPAVMGLDVVEPSAAMLSALTTKLDARSIPHQPHGMTWQTFRDRPATAGRTWDTVQMTFSAHTFLPADRPELLRWVNGHCKRFVMVEFDVPEFDEMLTAEVIGYYVGKYRLGLAEYADEAVVMQRFLMPVFFGNFAHDSQRLTFEQPAADWQADFKLAGLTNMQKRPIYDYWWGPAFMLTADGALAD